MRTVSHLLLCTLFSLLLVQRSTAQSWQWVVQTYHNGIGLYTETRVDSHDNTVALALTVDYIIFAKYDKRGNKLWERKITITPGPNTTTPERSVDAFSLDAYDNFYFIGTPIIAIDGEPVQTPGPFALIKFSPQGKLLWAKPINFEPDLLLQAKIVPSKDRLYMGIIYKHHTSLTYDGQTFDNPVNNNRHFIASIDTAGKLLWSKNIYSPPVSPPFCNGVSFPVINVTPDNELLLTGEGGDKLTIDGTDLIVTPTRCEKFNFAIKIDGYTGNMKWLKQLYPDTLAKRPNTIISNTRDLICLLPNGNILRYISATLDTLPSRIHKELLNNFYLYDSSGDLLWKKSEGNLNDGWYQLWRLNAGDDNSVYTTGILTYSGSVASIEKMLVSRLDSALVPIWTKAIDIDGTTPVFHPSHLARRKNSMTLLLGCGTEVFGGPRYAYFGNDSVLAYDKMLMARLVDSANTVSGKVYVDFNRNNVRDPDEPYLKDVLIRAAKPDDTSYVLTRSNGMYLYFADTGTVTLQPVNTLASYPNFNLIYPEQHTATITGNNNALRNKDFALQAKTMVNDCGISIVAARVPRPGFIFKVQVTVKNTGTTDMSPSYTLKLDNRLIAFAKSTLAPASISSTSLTYAAGLLRPLQTFVNEIEFYIKASAALGDTLVISAKLDNADAAAINNSDSAAAIIQGSFDPNDKQVYPFKNVNYDSVKARKQELDYVIRFQNTGTDTAFAVTILDTLDPRLDLSTFRVIQSSHPVEVAVLKPRTLEFSFPGILLPDSNRNEPDSHGFIQFRIKPVASVTQQDSILNTASIYFDYNVPVLTNEVLTNFLKLTVVTGIPGIETGEKYIVIHPNPVGNELIFTINQTNLRGPMRVAVLDAAGRLVLQTTKQVSSGVPVRLSTGSLSKGVYYLEVTGKKYRHLKKFIRE